MKNIQYCFLLVMLGTLAVSCKKDNYDPPGSKLTGRIVYNGEPIHVEHNRVSYEMFQYGFGQVGPILGAIAQDGSFSQLLFDGEYKLLFRPGQGPFLWPQTGDKADTITIVMAGSKEMDIEVNPYYMIRNPQITGSGTTVNATFQLEQIITGANAKTVENVNLYINKTQFVSGSDNIARTEVAGGAITDMNNISVSVSIPAIVPTQNYVFARIGVKMSGVEDMLFSPVVKIQY